MKDYLLIFRGPAFSGAMSLFKRILLPFSILYVLLSVVAAGLVLPLIMKGLNMGFGELLGFNKKFRDAVKESVQSKDFDSLFKDMFPSIDPVYLVLAGIVGILISCCMYVAYLKLNDNEIRWRNNSFMDAFKTAFSSVIFKIIGFFLLIYLIFLGVFIVYILIIALLMYTVKFLGILVGFIGFFFLLLFMLRFTIALPAIIHGNMPVTTALRFSYRKITWKRAAILFLMGLVFMIIMAIAGGIILGIVGSIFKSDLEDNMGFLITSQVLNTIISAITSAFVFAALSTIYFRYSDDEIPELDSSDHLISS